MAGFGEKNAPDDVTMVPREFIVQDLHGQTAMSPGRSRLCKICSFPEFDEKFFAPEHPIHADFDPDPVKRRNFNIGVGIIAVFSTALILLPVFMAISLGAFFNWSQVWLPLSFVYALIGALPFYLFYNSKVGSAWKRYASWVYQNAESKTVTAQTWSSGKHLSIHITYPNGHKELVYARFYGYDYSRLQKLNKPQSVSMRRDRTVRPAAVILEFESGQRLWCTSTSP